MSSLKRGMGRRRDSYQFQTPVLKEGMGTTEEELEEKERGARYDGAAPA